MFKRSEWMKDRAGNVWIRAHKGREQAPALGGLFRSAIATRSATALFRIAKAISGREHLKVYPTSGAIVFFVTYSASDGIPADKNNCPVYVDAQNRVCFSVGQRAACTCSKEGEFNG